MQRHGVKACPSYISESVTCRKLILSSRTLVGGCRCAIVLRLGPLKSFDYRPLGIDASFDLIVGH